MSASTLTEFFTQKFGPIAAKSYDNVAKLALKNGVDLAKLTAADEEVIARELKKDAADIQRAVLQLSEPDAVDIMEQYLTDVIGEALKVDLTTGKPRPQA